MTSDPAGAVARSRASLLSLRGRLGRVEFIADSAICALAASLFLAAFGYLLLLFPPGVARTWYSLALVTVMLLLLPLMFAMLSVKRLHDIGKPGWLALLLLVPIANCAFALMLWLWPGEARLNAYGGVPASASTAKQALAFALPALLVAGFLASAPPGGAQAAPVPSAAAASGAAAPPNALRPYPR